MSGLNEYHSSISLLQRIQRENSIVVKKLLEKQSAALQKHFRGLHFQQRFKDAACCFCSKDTKCSRNWRVKIYKDILLQFEIGKLFWTPSNQRTFSRHAWTLILVFVWYTRFLRIKSSTLMTLFSLGRFDQWNFLPIAENCYSLCFLVLKVINAQLQISWTKNNAAHLDLEGNRITNDITNGFLK